MLYTPLWYRLACVSNALTHFSRALAPVVPRSGRTVALPRRVASACCSSSGTMTAELGEEFLLSRQVEVLVVNDLVPHAFGVDGQAVGGDSPVVFGQEHAARKLLVFGGAVAGREACAELVDLLDELVRLQDLVRECREGKVKVVFDR
jgi:hypothetical protein